MSVWRKRVATLEAAVAVLQPAVATGKLTRGDVPKPDEPKPEGA